MERIDQKNFCGPRAYITDFDYKTVYRKSNKSAYKRKIERKLKVTLLTKNIIVCAASHLTHKFSYEFFKDNPSLLNKSMIIPALQEDKQHIVDYFKEKKIKKSSREEMSRFYEDNANKVVNWELIDNSTWFKNNLIKELNNQNSVIRRNLAKLPENKILNIIDEFGSQEILSRGFIIKTVAQLPRNEKRNLLNFTNLIYHMSGARVVNCESALPQENYIDYNLTDISQRKTILSETQIFWKIFLELAFETMFKENIPLELLDQLTFEDIYYLRKPIENSTFRKSYDDLIKKSIEVIGKDNPDELLFDMAELLKIKELISERFREVFANELPEKMKERRGQKINELGKNSLSLSVGMAGLFYPQISTIKSLKDLLTSSPELMTNLYQTFRHQNELDNYELYIKNKEKALHEMIKNSSLSNKTEHLDLVNLVVETIHSKTTL